MRFDHYCIDCQELIYIGYSLHNDKTSIEQWITYLCPNCNSNLILEIRTVKPKLINKALRRYKLKRILK